MLAISMHILASVCIYLYRIIRRILLNIYILYNSHEIHLKNSWSIYIILYFSKKTNCINCKYYLVSSSSESPKTFSSINVVSCSKALPVSVTPLWNCEDILQKVFIISLFLFPFSVLIIILSVSLTSLEKKYLNYWYCFWFITFLASFHFFYKLLSFNWNYKLFLNNLIVVFSFTYRFLSSFMTQNPPILTCSIRISASHFGHLPHVVNWNTNSLS